MNERGFIEDTIAALQDRIIHASHAEGAGGGHAPDTIRVAGLPTVILSSINPTRPITVNTIDEHLDMLMMCHHLTVVTPEDVALAESRIRRETTAAEDIPHDMGACSIVSSHNQAIGRVGEPLIRSLPDGGQDEALARSAARERGEHDNSCRRRHIAKMGINPAITQGISRVVGSVEVGKLAHLCLWNPAFFSP